MKIKVKTVISENSDKFIGIYAPFGILELYPTSHPFYNKMSILMDKEVKDLVVDLSNITFDDNKIIVMAEPLNMNEEQTIKKFAQDIEEILDRYPKTKNSNQIIGALLMIVKSITVLSQIINPLKAVY